MKKIISIILTIFTLGVLVSCGSFNEDAAKEESRVQLESLQGAFENGYEICSTTDIEEFETFVQDNLTDYFTESFITNANGKLTTKLGRDSNNDYCWFLSLLDNKVKFFSNFTISYKSIDSENETITYEINDDGTLSGDYDYITMVKEDGKWKVDSVEHL